MSDSNLYKRAGTYYARKKTPSGDIRRSLRTSSKVEALKRLRRFLDEVDAAKHGEEIHSWKAAVVEWSQAMVGAVKPDVLKRYKISLKGIRAVMDNLSVEEITTKTIAQVVKFRRTAGATNATIKRDLTAVSSVLRYACAQGWREDNPAKSYDRGVIRERRDPIVLPSTADIDAMVALSKGNFAKAIRYAQYTGMRQEEVFSLERGQIRDGVTDLWKTKTSRPRAVPNDDRAKGTLRGTESHAKTLWVFWHGAEGKRYLNVRSRFRQMVRKALADGNIKRAFRFHDLRHWYAVDYLRKGGNLYQLQQILGHSSIRTTELYLAYLTPDEAHAAKFGTGAQSGHNDSGSTPENNSNNGEKC